MVHHRPVRANRVIGVGVALACATALVGATSTGATASGRGLPPGARVVARIAIPAQGGEIAVGASGVWVTSWAGSTLMRIDPKSNAIAARITVKPRKSCDPMGPCGGIAVGSGAVWVALLTDNVVVRVDPKTKRVKARIAVGSQPDGVAASAGAIWVANKGGPTVSRIDPKTNKVVATIHVGPAGTEEHMAVTGGGGAVWVALEKPGAVVRIDPRTNKVVKTIKLSWLRSGQPCGYLAADAHAVWAAGGHCAASSGFGTVTKIDPRTNKVGKVMTAFKAPIGVALGSGSLWVADLDAKSVDRVNTSTGRVDARLHVGGQPIRLGHGFGSIWVRDDGGKVLRLQPQR